MRVINGSFAILFSVLAAGSVFAGPGGATEALILRVRVVDKETEIPRLAALQLDVAGVDVKANSVDFVGDQETYRELLLKGYFPEIVWRKSAAEATEALSQYLDPVEIAAKIDFYQTTYPTLAKKFVLAATSEGRTEWALKISDNVNLDEDEPAVLYVGQHHAREVMTTEITTDIIDYLLTRYATDAQVRAWVDGREIWVVPSHNPDGTNTVFTTTNLWRKNRRNNGGGNFGVDLNRNYPFFWNFCASGLGASSSSSSDTYRGPAAGSEPETQGIMQLASAQRPVVSLSYHTYSELVIQPYGCEERVSGELRVLRDYGSDLATRLRNDANDGWYSTGTPWELLYEVSGEADEWLYGELGIVPTTIEASSGTQGFQPDYNTWRTTTMTRNRPGWQYLLDRIDGPSIWGHTTDACTAAPLSATVGLDEVVFTNGETPRVSEPQFGRYQRLTVPGSYHLRVSKSGYATQGLPVEVGFKAFRQEVRLVPTGSFAVEALAVVVDDATGDGDGRADPGETVALRVTALATGGAVSGLTGVLATTDPFVSVVDATGAWPALTGGASAAPSDSFEIAVSPTAPDGHVASLTLTFSSAQSLCAATSVEELTIDTHAPLCPAVENRLDTNPGWTISGSGATGWAFGSPASGAVSGPASAHAGTNVYGTNLTGTYLDNADERLVTTAFDLSGLRNTELRFWRWLTNESGYDIASVDVSTDGSNFMNVWSGFGRDTAWQFYRFDISALADDQAAVYVRFRLQSDVNTTAAGFYVDDISICGDAAVAAPQLTVDGWTSSDAANSACTDGDPYGDGGEWVDLSVTVRNNGNALATGAVARLSASDPRIGMANFGAALGTIAPGATAVAAFRISIPAGIACESSLPLRIDFESNDGAFSGFDDGVALTLNADDGALGPAAFESFESASGWLLTGEWQIGTPLGLGGLANGGQGSPDPGAAVSGTKVLGVDLTGLGSRLGNYENSTTSAINADSPIYDRTAATHVELRFQRWLGVQRSAADRATIDAWDGSGWRTVWQNPDTFTADTAWQSVSYDVSRWAAGLATFRVRFTLTSNASQALCGWNIDDLRVTNNYAPRQCEGGACAAGCNPTTEVQGVTLQQSGGATVISWPAPVDPCAAISDANYRVYRSADPSPRAVPPLAWPQASYFTDVTGLDLDGTASNTAFSDAELPSPGAVFYYLVIPMGTNGQEGPKGWQGF